MKSGCLFAGLFALGGLLIFPFLAPLLFHGRDMAKLGQAAAFPIILVCGLIGLFFGLARGKKKPS